MVRERFALLGERWSNARDAAAREAGLHDFAETLTGKFATLQAYVEQLQGDPGQHNLPATRQNGTARGDRLLG